MANPWFRMYSEFMHDPKVQMMTEQDQRRLVMLLCMRCNGDVTLQDKHVTFTLRISEQEWEQTKANFIASGFIDSDNNILNWDKRQFISDSSAARVAKHRALHKHITLTHSNVTVTPPEQNRTEQNKTNAEKRQSREEEKKPLARGSRLPPDWKLPLEWGNWALQEKQGCTAEDVRKCAERFKDYWISVAGSKAVKVDWQATWRTWVRRDTEIGRRESKGINGKVLEAERILGKSTFKTLEMLDVTEND